MSRKLGPKENYRVEVEPKYYGYGPGSKFYKQHDHENGLQRTCDAIAEQIRRHVDYTASVRVMFDQHPVCEHCGSHWTEDSAEYNGGCCDKDQEAQEAREHSELAKG